MVGKRDPQFKVVVNKPNETRLGSFQSDRALLVFLLLSFIMRKTSAYDETQKSAVMPV